MSVGATIRTDHGPPDLAAVVAIVAAAALDFSRDQGYRRVMLWTVDLLAAAAHLYRAAGLRLVERRPGSPWGVPLVEERYEMDL